MDNSESHLEVIKRSALLMTRNKSDFKFIYGFPTGRSEGNLRDTSFSLLKKGRHN